MTQAEKTTPESFEAQIEALEMTRLWDVMSGLVRPEPPRTCAAHAWRYQDVRPLLDEAADTVPTELAERRVLILENPELRGSSGITQSLYAGLQIVCPEEIAPPHRHSQAALRFCLESDGAYTMVGERKIDMQPFDLVLTPPFAWHEHGNHGKSNAVWLDGLDIPMVRFFATEYAEHGPGVSANAHADADSRVQGRAHRPLNADGSRRDGDRGNGIVHYPYSQWRQSLDELMEIEGGPSVAMEFVDPATGGPAMNTIAAFARMVRAGKTFALPRSTESQVFVVVEGEGRIAIDDLSEAAEPCKVLVAPPWSSVAFEAQSDLVLFSYSDRAAQRALGFWRLEGMAV